MLAGSDLHATHQGSESGRKADRRLADEGGGLVQAGNVAFREGSLQSDQCRDQENHLKVRVPVWPLCCTL